MRLRFLGSEFPPAPPAGARFHVIPVPYEKTASYGKGTARGPAAIIAASQQLEAFTGAGIPGNAGIHTAPAVLCAGSPTAVLARIAKAVSAAVASGGIPVLLGGEHTISLGAIKALAGKRNDFGVVQFDAHADLRDSYEGSPFSHACVMRRILELGVPVFQIGVRALCLDEHRLRIARRIPHLDAAVLARRAMPRTILPARFPRHIYISFDLDAFDPSLVPATGTPVPGGLTWYQALELLGRVAAGRRVIGMDIVELAPQPGAHASEFAAALLAYEMMGLALGRL